MLKLTFAQIDAEYYKHVASLYQLRELTISGGASLNHSTHFFESLPKCLAFLDFSFVRIDILDVPHLESFLRRATNLHTLKFSLDGIQERTGPRCTKSRYRKPQIPSDAVNDETYARILSSFMTSLVGRHFDTFSIRTNRDVDIQSCNAFIEFLSSANVLELSVEFDADLPDFVDQVLGVLKGCEISKISLRVLKCNLSRVDLLSFLRETPYLAEISLSVNNSRDFSDLSEEFFSSTKLIQFLCKFQIQNCPSLSQEVRTKILARNATGLEVILEELPFLMSLLRTVASFRATKRSRRLPMELLNRICIESSESAKWWPRRWIEVFFRCLMDRRTLGLVAADQRLIKEEKVWECKELERALSLYATSRRVLAIL